MPARADGWWSSAAADLYVPSGGVGYPAAARRAACMAGREQLFEQCRCGACPDLNGASHQSQVRGGVR
jgi:hypothetical protein